MSLLTINANFDRVVAVLTRIADALDRYNPPIPEEQLSSRRRGPESIVQYGNEKRLWASEQFQNLIHEKGLAPAKEQEILDHAMSRYDNSDEDPDESPL